MFPKKTTGLITNQKLKKPCGEMEEPYYDSI